MTTTSTTAERCVIRASAGTGKTFALSNRFIRLLAAGDGSGGDPLDGILATTFTRKAAGEILARVIGRVAEASLDEDQAGELARHVELKRADTGRWRQVLVRMVRRLHRLRVGTLDSFFIQVAGAFALELKLPLGWRITDELDEERVRRHAIRRLLAEYSATDAAELMHLLGKDDAGRSVAAEIDEVVRSLYEVYAEAPPAAWETVPRLKRLTPLELSEAIQRLADLECEGGKRVANARDGDVERAWQGDWETFVAKGPAKAVVEGHCTYYKKPLPAGLVAAYEPIVEHAKAELTGRVIDQTSSARRLLEHYATIFRQLKWQHRGLSFADVTRLLASGEVADRLGEVAYRLDAPVRHLLLDEFQDTAPAQWHVLRPFARRIIEDSPHGSFFCVGDVKQAIFGWRGGMAEIFDALDREFPALAADSLTRSYRSSPVIIDTVNAVFTDLAKNKVALKHPAAAEAWAARFQPHSTAREELPGYCCMETAPLPVTANDTNETGEADMEDPADGEATTDEESTVGEANMLTAAADLIARLHARSPDRTIGVLARKNATVAGLIFHLRQKGILASEEGGNPLTDSPAVTVILSLLKLADHPGDSVARFHLATSPLGEPLGLTDHCDESAAVRLAVDVRRQLMDRGYGPTVERWIEILAPACESRDLRRLAQLAELAYIHEPAATSRADDFLQRVQHQRVEDPLAARIRVMTMHKAKGLQFDIVVLPELDDQLLGQGPRVVVGRDGPAGEITHIARGASKPLLPLLPKPITDAYELARQRRVEESFCLLYVALTRAVHALHVLIAPSPANERSLHSTSAGLLRAALTNGEKLPPGAVFYEKGDPDWARAEGRDDGREPTAPEPAAAGRGELPSAGPPPGAPGGTIRLAPSTGRFRRGLRRMTPSGLEGGRHVRIGNMLRLDNRPALQRGTAIHAWFEQIDWLEEGLPDERRLREVAAEACQGSPGCDLNELLARFHEMLRQPAVARLLSREAYRADRGDWIARAYQSASASGIAKEPDDVSLEVHREWPFVLREGEDILRGSIDRLVLLTAGKWPVAAEVIDFKSDRVEPGDAAALAERVDRYRPQMAAYRRAVAMQFRLAEELVDARLLFVAPGIVVDLP